LPDACSGSEAEEETGSDNAAFVERSARSG